jgi:hypothetical protein
VSNAACQPPDGLHLFSAPMFRFFANTGLFSRSGCRYVFTDVGAAELRISF